MILNGMSTEEMATRAYANAVRGNRAYIIYSDTSGNWHCDPMTDNEGVCPEGRIEVYSDGLVKGGANVSPEAVATVAGAILKIKSRNTARFRLEKIGKLDCFLTESVYRGIDRPTDYDLRMLMSHEIAWLVRSIMSPTRTLVQRVLDAVYAKDLLDILVADPGPTIEIEQKNDQGQSDGRTEA